LCRGHKTEELLTSLPTPSGSSQTNILSSKSSRLNQSPQPCSTIAKSLLPLPPTPTPWPAVSSSFGGRHRARHPPKPTAISPINRKLKAARRGGPFCMLSSSLFYSCSTSSFFNYCNFLFLNIYATIFQSIINHVFEEINCCFNVKSLLLLF